MRKFEISKKMMAFGFGIVAATCFMIHALEMPVQAKEIKQQSQPRNTAFVLGITENNPVIDLQNIEELKGLFDYPGSSYSCMIPDSKLTMICEGKVLDFSSQGYSKAMKERILKGMQAEMKGYLEAAAPKSNEIDFAAATEKAVRFLGANSEEGAIKTVVYAMSGIATSGVIDMTETPLFELDIEESVKEVASILDLDMSDIEVVFYYCGDTSGEQLTLSNMERQRLKEFYEKLFLAFGAKSVIFKKALPLDGCYDFEQSVSVMETEECTSALKKIIVVDQTEIQNVEETETAYANGTVLKFDEKSIQFLPDSAEISDKEMAKESLSYTITFMQNNPDFTLLIAATTSSDGEAASCREFSKSRGQAVKNLLVEEGIPEDHIVILGCGYSCSAFYIPDRNDDGTLNKENAAKNRSCRLLDFQSEAAKEILAEISSL